MATKRENLIGQRFGMLTILQEVDPIPRPNRPTSPRRAFLCKCDCGNETTKTLESLVTGNTKSCGCLSHKHQQTGTRLYRIWAHMKARCLNPNDQKFYAYGARGIKVCDEWLEFEPFCEWAMNNGYESHLSIDRKDVNGNYSPENCHWTTMVEQQNNRTNNHDLTFNGETLTIAQWAKKLGIYQSTIQRRLKRGLDIAEVLAPTKITMEV